NLQEKEARLSNELAQDRQQLNHVLYNQKRLTEEHLTEQNKLDRMAFDMEKLRAEVEELRGQQQTAKKKLDDQTRKNNESRNAAYKLEKEIAVLHIQRDALSQEGLRNVADTESKAVELDQFNTLVAELEVRVDTLSQEQELANQLENDLQQQIDN